MKKLFANIVDQIIVFGGAALLLVLVTLLLKLIGFEFVKGVLQYAYMVSIAVVAILYFPIVESTKLNTTIGKKLLGIE